MDIPSLCFLGAFLGSTLGLPAGFMLIELIKLVQSRRDRPAPFTEIIEWAIMQPGCKVIEETQIANNWVRTMDFQKVMEPDRDPETGEEIAPSVELPARYATQIVGGVGAPDPVLAQGEPEAVVNHHAAVNKVRKLLGIIPR